MWIATEDRGLFYFDQGNDSIIALAYPGASRNVHGLCQDGDWLWVGAFAGGLTRINLRTGAQKHYGKAYLNADDVFSIRKTARGVLYVGTIHGLLRYNENTDDFTAVEQLEGHNVNDIFEDSSGHIWVATYAGGVCRYDVYGDIWTFFKHDPDNTSSLPCNKVTGCYEDSNKRIWVMTQGGGLCLYDPAHNRFIRHSIQEGFPSSTIYSMQEDGYGNLWVSTTNGLVCFNPDNSFMRVYTVDDGIQTNQFNYQASYKDAGGWLYFGSINGFIRFNPDSFTENKFIPPIAITDLWISNRLADVGASGSPLVKSINHTDRLELPARQNSFSLHAVALSYHSPNAHKLVCKLEGLDDDWHEVGATHIINYSHLPYGDYTLRLKNAALLSEMSVEKTLQICILPPFYLSACAKIVYVLVALAFIGVVLLLLHRRYTRQHSEMVEKMERQKERDLYNAKIKLFTNITHEIRTPLTLIKVPLEGILSAPDGIPEQVYADLKIMDANAGRLLELVNQLLEFRKVEDLGSADLGEHMRFAECRIDLVLEEIYRQFSPLAISRHIEYRIVRQEKVTVYANKEGITKIITNLFSNALKYSKSYVHVSLWVEDGRCRLAVCNDGAEIPVQMREEVFEPFVRCPEENGKVAAGSGIGLSLARSLAELHHGTLTLESGDGQTCFILSVPVNFMGIAASVRSGEVAVSDVDSSHPEYTIMLVEDNSEMGLYMARRLSAGYRVLSASSGRMALETLKTESVDLVLSDIMMPDMDGLELCQHLKSDLNYSHIPVILLTAKIDLQDKIEGMKCGADAYLEKPFSFELLHSTIDNLLDGREKLRTSYMKQPFVSIRSGDMNKADLEFLRHLSEVMNEHLSDFDFNLEQMAGLLNVSVSTLHRKMKSLLNVSPNAFIRAERLKKAACLFKEGNHHISDVCYMTGFTSHSYFTACFQKQFGKTPKEFIDSL